MARGFESKAVADQQEAAQTPQPGKDPNQVDSTRLARRRTLELSRADVLRRLETAQAEAHREMLRRALAALDAEIASLS
jgi:hypothetical protein